MELEKMPIRTLATSVLCLAFAGLAPAGVAQAAQAAAATPGAQVVAAADLEIGPVAAEADDLASRTVVDRGTGATFKVFFDPISAAVARDTIPLLAAFYRRVAELVAVDPGKVDWASVLFARNAEDLVLTRKEGLTLWRVDVAADGQPSETGIKTLYQVVPHEQVHATQHLGHGPMGLARWFAEGQATWAGVQVTDEWRPDLAREERARRAGELAASKQPLALGQWGGVHPKPEAILRQLTPEQRAQFEKDPSSVQLSGTFRFGPDDFLQDESNSPARYGASLALFERIDAQAGRPAVLDWFRAVQQAGPTVDSNRIAALASDSTGVDITRDLR
jgi:hypothetical protein